MISILLKGNANPVEVTKYFLKKGEQLTKYGKLFAISVLRIFQLKKIKYDCDQLHTKVPTKLPI